jgi:hypothetical protein
MSAKRVNQAETQLLIFTGVIFILFLTAINIERHLLPEKVLGTETQNRTEIFWESFLKENPNYIPGWIEIGRIDKAMEIDPNYQVSRN